MANGIKQFKIVINGLTESVSAVDALNKQLDALEKRIEKINSMKITSTGGSGTGSRGSSGILSEEAKLEKQIEQIEAKREAYSKEIYQNYLASKEQLNETLKDQRNIAAQERLQAKTYSNTIRGMKEELRDIKEAMQTIDLSDNAGLKKMTERANELNTKLKEIEQSYGQFGRNVGNYKSAADGFNKIKVAVGETVREYDNYRQAMKSLRNEEFQLAQTLGKESEEYKNVHVAIKELESDYKDLSVSSQFMDNILDSMQTLTSFGQIGVGLTSIFGIDDKEYQESMTRMMGLMSVLQGIEKLKQQWDADDSWLMKPFKKLYSYLEGAGSKITDFFTKTQKESLKIYEESLGNLDEWMREYKTLTSEQKKVVDEWLKANYGENFLSPEYIDKLNGKIAKTEKIVRGVGTAFRWVGKAIMSIFTAGLMLMLPEIIEFFTDLIKSLNTTKIAADKAAESLNGLNRQLKARMDVLGASYLRGEISDENYLLSTYNAQTKALVDQIDALKSRAKVMESAAEGWGRIWNMFDATQNTEFTGKKLTGETTVGHGRLFNFLEGGNDFEIIVKNVKEVDRAWKMLNESVLEGKDYFDKWGTGFGGWYKSLFVTVKDTEEVMRGLGNVRLSDTIAQFQELNRKYKDGKIDADQYAQSLHSIAYAMNNNEILNSVIANLDKYIPDDKTREAIQNIINKIYELDDAFNMTSPEQIHHWNQVRIDAMEDGFEKTKAQILENQRWQIEQEGKTAEQQKLIKAKYAREMKNAEEKYRKEAATKAKEHAKKLNDVDDWLAKLRIENMQKGWKKREAEINLEWEQELRKAKEGGIKVKELEAEINKKYDAKIKEERIKWASDMLRIYQDLAQNIQQINKATFETETSTASRNVSNKSAKAQQDTGSSTITPTNYDDVKNLENYYKKILAIKKDEVDKELAIEREKLDKELEYAKEEEKLRHEREVDVNSGEYAKQLKEGLLTQEQYNDLIEKENLAHNARMNAIDKEYFSNLNELTREELENTQQLYNEYYTKIISDVSTERGKIDKLTSRQPVRDSAGWGVVNIGKTSENYNTSLSQYDDLKQKIIQKQRELDAALKANTISPEDFVMRQSDLKKEIEAIDNAVEDVKKRQKELIGEFMQSISGYIQAGMQSLQDIMQSIWDAQDNNFDKEQEYLDKLNDELDNKLNEQENIIRQHNDAINSIEDELASARGDRRQHLIDQLNAEIAAQRAAAKERKKIEKEQEQAQKKQDKLDKDRKKAQYQRDMMQAIVNGAMAVTMAAVNAWPVPAIPMMALAAATTAAQIAVMASNKPYAKGGLLEGKSHAQGGIPIPGTGIEVEGKEYVVRKKSTAPNIGLLEYINKSERKINLDDMIDFYTGGKAKKTIGLSSPIRKYETGGVIPSLRSDIDINNRILTAIEDYSNKPTVVQVVDIIDRTQAVKEVQVMAGLEV